VSQLAEKTKPEKSHKAKLREFELEKAQIDLTSARLDLEREQIRHRDDLRVEKWNGARGTYHGTFRLDGGITAQVVADLTVQILQWKRVQGDKRSPITLHISSGGGDAYASLALFDTLRTLSAQGHHVTTIIRGFAASGAGVIAQAGDLRLIGAESFLHIHEAGSGIMGKAAEVKDEALALEQMSRKMADIYASRSSLSADDIYARFERREWWITAAHALELGFADEIG